MLRQIAGGAVLDEDEAIRAFTAIMEGEASPAQIGAFLMGLSLRGETVAEITAAARILRERALAIKAPPGAIDVCGTGGDSSGSFNISTAVAILVAACGVPVAKHGNLAISSKSGSADVLRALGVDIGAGPAIQTRCLAEINLCFMMAPLHHSTMRHVAHLRDELGMRTLFNLLGPLVNPAGTLHQLVGVYAERWVEPIAAALGNLGITRGWVVHGSDGLDELTIAGSSQVAEWSDGRLSRFEVTPEMAGLRRWPSEALRGGDAQHNAAALTRLLSGETGAYRDVVLLNSAAALVIAGRAADLASGAAIAARALDDGAATLCLQRLIAITHSRSPE